MRILKWLAGVVGVALLAVVALVIGARFADGPLAIIPGGLLASGELVAGAEPDWTFARDISEMEFQLVEPPRSRTTWLQVHDTKLYVVSGYMNSALGHIWKQWPAQAVRDGRAVIRIDGKRYERQLVRVLDDRPLLEAITAEVNRKHGAGLTADMAESGDAWFFAVEPRHQARPLPAAAIDPTTTDAGAPMTDTSRAASSAPANPSPSPEQIPPVGDRVHISGCDFGELTDPAVDLWDSADRTRVVGQLSGDGGADQGLRCLGAVVIIRSVDSGQPTTMYEVETVVGNQRGWVSELFIGPTIDVSLCGALFSNSSAAAGKCLG
jgi:hypothetical protein